MRRSMLVIIGLLILSILSLVATNDVEAVGQPTITISMIMDYNGYDPDDPIDISTGFVGIDPFQKPTLEEIVVIEGTIEISSDLPNVVQKIIIELDSHVSNEDYGDIFVDYSCYPEKMIFANLMPGQTLSSNYTMSVVIDSSVPAGENIVYIGGWWYHDPIPTGGELPDAGGLLYVSPVVSAGFEDTFDNFLIGPNDQDSMDVDMVNNGNVREPELELTFNGLEGSDSDLYLSHTLDMSLDYLIIRVFTGDVQPGESWEIKVILVDVENDTELDSFDFTLLITGDSPVDDDDDPYEPPVDDEDQLWSFEECERTYTDASADDLTYWSTLDSSFETHSGIEIDQNPMVDIKRVEVSREGDNLVIEIKMNGVPDLGITGSGISNIYLYLLDRDSGHLQPPLEMGNDLDMTEEDYEPTSVLATTSLYHGGSFWISEQEVIGSNYLIRGSISSLISIGVDPDFELFVKVAYTDLENFATEDSLNVRITRDYAGYGAWEVDRSLLSEDVSDQGADPFGSGNIKAIGVAVAIIVFLVVLIISIFAISRRKNRHKPDYPDRYY